MNHRENRSIICIKSDKNNKGLKTEPCGTPIARFSIKISNHQYKICFLAININYKFLEVVKKESNSSSV